jgi:hypothetical protein
VEFCALADRCPEALVDFDALRLAVWLEMNVGVIERERPIHA